MRPVTTSRSLCRKHLASSSCISEATSLSQHASVTQEVKCLHAQFHAKTALNLSWTTSKLVAKQLQLLRGILYGVEFPYLTPMFQQWVLWVLQTPSEMEWCWVQSKNGSMLRNAASLPVQSSCSGVLASFVWTRMAKGLVELPESRICRVTP